jgi:hypothetical protein
VAGVTGADGDRSNLELTRVNREADKGQDAENVDSEEAEAEVEVHREHQKDRGGHGDR